MINPPLGSFSLPLFAWWLLFVLSPAQTGGPPSEQVRQSADDSIARKEQEETVLHFSDYVDGGGWSVQLALSNVDPDAATEVRVEVYDPDGQAVLDLFDSDLTLEIPALGSRVLRSSGSGDTRRGWIQVGTDAPTISGLLTYRHARSGVEVGVQPVELGNEFALFVEESPMVGSGVAVFKPDASSRLALRIRDEEGHDPLEGGFVPWEDFQQAARTLPEWFAAEGVDTGFLADFRGLLFLETEDESPFAPLGLRFGKRTSSLSAVPAIRTQSGEPQEASLVFPDYVDGGGWSVQLVLTNVDPDASAEVGIEVYGQDGQPVLDLFDSDLTLEIPAQGSRVWRSTGSGAIRRGWIQVEADTATISGLLTYRDVRSGIEVGVEPAQLGKQFALFVEESGTVGTGLAVFKPDAESRIELRVHDEEGNDPLNGLFLPRRDFHQSALTLPEWIDVPGVDAGFLRDFRGLLFLRTEDESGFAPLGLRFGKGTSSLSAVPAIRIPDDSGTAPPPTVTLSASPSSIDRGQGTTLTWSSTNAESAEIEPDIGMVATSGTRRVSPNVTTTYRIAVRGADGQTATVSVTVTVAVSERQALGALYDDLGGSDWTRSDNWLTDAPLRDWYGVEVDSQGRIIELRLFTWMVAEDGSRTRTGLGLTGEIPPELGSLLHLRVLDFSGNQLTGEIPPELGALTQLVNLDLHGNQLTGKIPPELGALRRLTVLDFSGNRLTGEIPPELGALAQLERLYLYRNQLTGEIPPELRALTRLEDLFLYGNQLTGEIPSELGALAQLERLYLNENQLMGEIPPELGALAQLEILNLGVNRLTGEIPPELGMLAQLKDLSLPNNQLTGEIPPELGTLAQLENLYLAGNQLTGEIPPSFLDLDELGRFSFRVSGSADLCAPGTPDFVAWLQGMQYHDGAYCNESDVAVLDYLYRSTGGEDWTNSDGWLGDSAVTEWYGVQTDSLGRVTGLDLSRNGLTGRLPATVVRLSQLTALRVGGNTLSGRLPLALARLPLREFHYVDTNLCVPSEPAFSAWLDGLPSHDGTGVKCGPPKNRDLLSALYDMTGGPNWTRRDRWLTGAPLEDWFGVKVDGQGRVIHLLLIGNQLEGEIPPELGTLAQLQFLNLSNNQLEGPIPAELGALSNLRGLYLNGNQLTGEIPPELGHLSDLRWLELNGNELEGKIPAELGNLSKLQRLEANENRLEGETPAELGNLSGLEELEFNGNRLEGRIPPALGKLANLQVLSLWSNRLDGGIPPELGNLAHLERLELENNDLTGAVPPELGRMSSLKTIGLTNNTRMSGALPAGLASLRRLEALLAGGTDLCAPSDARFLDWLEGVWKRRVARCAHSSPPMAYLTQAVQSREFPVPLVAGEEALLRVFVTTTRAGGHRIPPVRARFYVDGRETYVAHIPGKSTPVPTEVREGSLSASANAAVPGEIVQPGLELVVEIDPGGTLGSAPGLTKRIPEAGRLAVEVETMPVFDLTVIPFLWAPSPDTSVLAITKRMSADPEGHELLGHTRTLLPIEDLEVTAHEPVLSSNNNLVSLLHETEVIRTMEGGKGHYMGTMTGEFVGNGAAAKQNDWVFFSKTDLGNRSEYSIAHEVGHNIGLYHISDCGGTFPDPSFPYPGGAIGVWGYDFESEVLVSPFHGDLMGDCGEVWISDYHFTNALRYRLHTAASGGLSSLAAAPAGSLLLWGGVDAVGAPFLEPVFAVVAPASLPRSTGDHQIVGRTAGGEELFSLRFPMPELADGDGRFSFAFVLPAPPEWADRLASVTLSGPGGSFMLDSDADRPVTILRNPRTGQIRAILRGEEAAPENLDAAVSSLSVEPGMERMTSRGIPDPDDWTQWKRQVVHSENDIR